MPLVAPAIKEKFKKRIMDGLKREFTNVSAVDGYSPVAEAHWLKLANAISDIAIDMVAEIQQNAQVLPGIAVQTAGAPTNHVGATTAPGKIA